MQSLLLLPPVHHHARRADHCRQQTQHADYRHFSHLRAASSVFFRVQHLLKRLQRLPMQGADVPPRVVHLAGNLLERLKQQIPPEKHRVIPPVGQFAQLRRDKDAVSGKSLGLRINPECSTQGEHAIYDPCAPGSRLGVTKEVFDCEIAAEPELFEALDGLHFHTLCEQNADDLAKTLEAV